MTIVFPPATHGLETLSVSDSVLEPPFVRVSFIDIVTASFMPKPSNVAEAPTVYDSPCSKTLDQVCVVDTVFDLTQFSKQ